MNENVIQLQSCPRCQSPIPPSGLCPACLMSQALVGSDDKTLTWSPGPTSSGPELGPWPQALGDYQLLRLLGSGGMGQVYEAEHRPTGRRVALKRLAQRLDSPEMRQRFLREGRLAASVSHPHSLYVFGSEDIAGAPVITMEIAEGGTLEDELAKQGPLPVKQAVDAILDVLSGLEAASAVGVLHRDIKPSNCFVMPDGSVKIGDYGLSISSLSRDDSYLTASGQIMGTPAYASPEQLRGDDLDLRADIYSVGATLYTLLTGRAPFKGHNAVQVVANAVNLAPKKLGELREGLPPGLERIVSRCLEKDPDGRFSTYLALSEALIPYSSRESEPVPMNVRSAAGWIDFLLAFFVPYVVLVLLVGSVTFHFGWLMERTLVGARYYLALVAFGLLYFTLAEGLWGGGFGKRYKGLQVIRPNGGRPGPLRASIRILSPILTIEAVRLPLIFSTITAIRLEEVTLRQNLIYTGATVLAPWIPILLDEITRRADSSVSLWDRLSGTRVVFRPTGNPRPTVESVPLPDVDDEKSVHLGPYRVDGEIVRGRWLTGIDTVLHRPVWLVKRQGAGPSDPRRCISRPGRPRWLQKTEGPTGVWDAYEASPGAPFRTMAASGRRIPWGDLRHWLHDVASELWAAGSEGTLPAQLGLDHIWLTSGGRGMLLDLPWPASMPTKTSQPTKTSAPTKTYQVDDLAGRQRFLYAMADRVETTSLPLHARPLLRNLGQGRFEKLSFLVGTLRGLLDRPAEVSRGVRAGALFMLPIYCLVMTLVGARETAQQLETLLGSFGSIFFFAMLLIAACAAVAQLLLVPFRTTTGHALFRLAVVDAGGRLASRRRLLARWAVAWLPLALALFVTAQAQPGLASTWPRICLVLWLGAALHAALDPHRGLHDRLAGTWVVMR